MGSNPEASYDRQSRPKGLERRLQITKDEFCELLFRRRCSGPLNSLDSEKDEA